MADETLKLPTWENTPTLAEQAATQYDLTSNWLDYTQSYPEPLFLLEYGGVPFAPLGGIQAITGQKKNGKTFLMAQLMAAILCGDSERMRSMLPTLQLHQPTLETIQTEPRVLYIDTEMEKLNTVKVVRRVQWLCGWDYSTDNDRLRALWLRSEESNAVRWGKSKQAIIETHPTAIFLDGIRDVIGDFNDNKESADLISECMKIATEMNCCIFSVLHENPGSEKMRGHLGTELGNKVTDTFVSVKEKKDNVVTFTVKQVDARGKDVPDWKFEITEDAGGLGVPRIIDETAAPAVPTKKELSDDEWANVVKAMKEIVQPPKAASFTSLRDGIKSRFRIGSTKAERWMQKALEDKILIMQGNKFLFNIQDGDATIQKLPF